MIVDIVGSTVGSAGGRCIVGDGSSRYIRTKNHTDPKINDDIDDNEEEEEEEENQPGAVRVRGIYAFDDDEDDTTFLVGGADEKKTSRRGCSDAYSSIFLAAHWRRKDCPRRQ